MYIKMNKKEEKRMQGQVSEIARQSSERERAAMEAERAVDDLKKAEYIAGYIGETFAGVVSGVTQTALFVELDNTIEGVVPLASLEDDYYAFFEKMYCVIGERTKKRYNLGDEVTIVVKDVDILTARIEFEIVS